MPRFRFSAIDTGGREHHGEQSATSAESLKDILKQRGWLPIRIEETTSAGLASLTLTGRGGGRLLLKDKVFFTASLATLLDAGLALDNALASINKLEAKPALKELSNRLLARVQKGSSFADALTQEGTLFDSQYVALVRAGESSGSLTKILQSLSDGMERSYDLQEKLRNAMQYPVLVLAVAAVTLFILMTAVVPQFQPIFDQAEGDLPFITSVVIGLSVFMQAYWWSVPMAAVAVALAIAIDLRQPAGRLRWHASSLRLPLVGLVIKQVDTARFCRTLGMLLANGLPALTAFDLAKDTIWNLHLAKRMAGIRNRIERGEGFARPIKEIAVFPELAVHLIQVGEDSGHLQGMLIKAADFYEKENRNKLEKYTKLLTPVVTILLGGLVAMIIGAVLSAILNIYNLPL